MSIPLLWQTLLLMTVAYLVGAALACFVRRSFFSAHVPAPHAVTAAPAKLQPAAVAARSAPPPPTPIPVSVPVAMPGPARGAVSAPIAPSPPVASGTSPAPAAVRTAAGEAFRRADHDAPEPQAAPAPAARPPAIPAVAASPTARAPAPTGQADRFRQALSGPAGTGGATAPAGPAFDSAAAAAASAAAAAAAGLPRRESGDAAPPDPAHSVRPVVVVPAGSRPMPSSPAASADDLKRIRAIDEGLEAKLNALGVSRFDQIATWHAQDVAKFNHEFGFRGRIEHENWIEQAQILARGEETFYSRRRAKDQSPPSAVAAPASRTPSRPDGGQGLDNATADAARKAAELSAQLLRATSPAVAAPTPGAVVASPGTSAALAAAAAAAAAASAAVISTPSTPHAAATPAAVAPPDVPQRAAFAGAGEAARSDPPIAPVPEAASAAPLARTSRDQLQRIAGINAEIEKLLNVQGVGRFSQIANWSRADIDRFDRLLGHPGRIARENWIEQAQILSKGSDTAYSREFERRLGASTTPPSPSGPTLVEASPGNRPARLVDALQSHARPTSEPTRTVPRPGDLSSLRSVRSEAYRNEPSSASEAAAAGATGASPASAETVKIVRSSTPDDLKRIRGVGVLIEKKLNSMGIVRYEQIANWTTGDIERVSQALDFKGRIERENWVEQARILGSGGHTDFSRRVDRGDVETSRGRP